MMPQPSAEGAYHQALEVAHPDAQYTAYREVGFTASEALYLLGCMLTGATRQTGPTA